MSGSLYPLCPAVTTQSGGVTNAANIGGGTGLFSSLNGTILEFKTLVAGTNVTISQVGSALHLSAPSVGFSPATSYNGIANPAITGAYLHQGEFNVQAGTGNVTLQSDLGNVNILAPNGAQQVNVTAPLLNLNGTLQTVVTTPQLTVNTGAQVTVNASTDISLSAGGDINFPTLKPGSASDVIYYNPLDNSISHAAAPSGGFDPSQSYTVTGLWDFTNPTIVFSGIPSATTSEIVYYNNGAISHGPAPQSFDPSQGYQVTGIWDFTNSTIKMSGIPQVNTSDIVYYNNGFLTYGPATSAFSTSNNYLVTGTWSFSNSDIKMTGLTAGGTAYVLCYNNLTGAITYASASGFDQAGTYVLTGSWTFNCPFSVTAPTGDVNITSTAGTINLTASTVNKYVNITSNKFQTTVAQDATITANKIFLNGTSEANLTTPLLTVSANTFRLQNIANSATTRVLYYNTFDASVTYGDLPGSFAWQTVTGSSFVIAANTGYIINAGSQVTCQLPASPVVGDVYEIRGYSASGWTISQNSGQKVICFAQESTVGAGGSITSTQKSDGIRFMCVDTNVFSAQYIGGSLTVV